MPEPSRLVWRSELGWSAYSPASEADPKSGLVIHYDSYDQGLPDKPHGECIDYWNRTRDYHVNNNGWVDIGYCVDEATEILTADGWKTFRQVRPGELALTLDHATGLARWQPILDVYVFPAGPREMIRMTGRSHSSLTTPHHRWPVERPAQRDGGAGEWTREWATTATLADHDRIPTAAPCADLPTEAKWSDALVELVAWLRPEDPTTPPGPESGAGAGVVLRQRSPANAARVRAALHALFGPPAPPGRVRDGAHLRWHERASGQAVEFHLSAEAGRALLDQAPGRVVRHEFLSSLTRAQLTLFLDVALRAGGGSGRSRPRLAHPSREAAEAFQFAATLAGHATSVTRRPPASATDHASWLVRLGSGTGFTPGPAATERRDPAARVVRERYEGHVWCVRTPNATWLARRAGTVYFTGNSFMACAHGYVIEGRGLFRQQAAQVGYNATYYSCTLATGPNDSIPDAQIEAVRELRQWLMEPDTSIAGTVVGHRDLNSTSCPGDKAYALVQGGDFAQPPTGDTQPETEDFLDMADLQWVSSHRTQKLPKGETVCLLWQNGRNDEITEDNPYATIAFQNHKFTGSLNGHVVALDENGEAAPVSYRVQLGKVTGAVGSDEPPDPLFRGGLYTTTECNMALDEITWDEERLRVYVTALVDGCEWRGGKVTGWLAPR